MKKLFAVFAVFVFSVLAVACDGSSSAADASRVYVSMGDSVAAGNGSSDPAATSFAALLGAHEGVTLFNAAVAGATTDAVIEHQLPRVLPLADAGRVRLITISAGGNDFAALIPNASCLEDPPPPSCPIEETLDTVESNLNALLDHLRQSNRTVPVVLLAYPNLFSGTDHVFAAPAARVLARLDEVIERVAARHEHTYVARPWDRFDGRGGELTHILDVPSDPHPNDAGHRAIADAFVEALEGP